MARVEESVEVQVPVTVAYNQWTQFEEFPRFMDAVDEVQQLDARRLHWRASVGGKTKEWDAEIQEQTPDSRIIWRNTSGSENAGVVTFAPLAPDRTRINLLMSYDPEGTLESMGDHLGFMSRRVSGDLKRFKEFIEREGGSSGAWRGDLENRTLPGGHTTGEAAQPNREAAASIEEPPGEDVPSGEPEAASLDIPDDVMRDISNDGVANRPRQ